jgi:uncharacterized membrane protein YecN with MAPEG domain
MPILTAAYGSILALFFVALSIRVIQLRYKHQVSLGDGGAAQLERAIRAQGNCAEYAPIALLLMLFCELLSGPAWLIHAVGVVLVAGRLAHGVCFACMESSMVLRRAGMLLTFAAILTAALANLVIVISAAN